MNTEQKKQIKKLRIEGLGYKKIANELGISVNTIKSFCRNNNLTSGLIPSKIYCKECGKEIIQKEHVKKRVFCCDECKRRWWNNHKLMHKKTMQEDHVCSCCNKLFMAYPHENRKYCSHSCYIKGRFKQGDSNE